MTEEVEWWKAEEIVRKLATNQAHALKLKREIVPIIFLPGIMGSRLVRAEGEEGAAAGEVAWDPDDTGFVGSMMFASPARRKRRVVGASFKGSKLKPAEKLSKDATKEVAAAAGTGGIPTVAEAEERGWAGVFWGSYKGILFWLSGLTHGNALQGVSAPVSLDVIFQTPVYAIGYNWTDTNADNGKRVAARIAEIIAKESAKGPCVKAIVVTHSMGGIAARSASELAGAQAQIQGIVHGVQPVVGAAAAYWRMRGGFESGWFVGQATSEVLGATGRAVTAVLANIPGGLELLPHPDYVVPQKNAAPTKAWLRIFDEKDNLLDSWPKADPYADIYNLPSGSADPPFWRAVDPLRLDPMREKPAEPAELAGAIAEYRRVLRIAESFVRAIAGKRHPLTYAFWGENADRNSATVVDLTISRSIDWSLPAFSEAAKAEAARKKRPMAEVIADPGLKRVRSKDPSDENGWKAVFEDSLGVRYVISMKRPAGPGDGTVPALSGSFIKPVNPGTVPSPRIDGDHQAAYDDGGARAFTRKAIVNLLLARMNDPDRLGGKAVFK